MCRYTSINDSTYVQHRYTFERSNQRFRQRASSSSSSTDGKEKKKGEGGDGILVTRARHEAPFRSLTWRLCRRHDHHHHYHHRRRRRCRRRRLRGLCLLRVLSFDVSLTRLCCSLLSHSPPVPSRAFSLFSPSPTNNTRRRTPLLFRRTLLYLSIYLSVCLCLSLSLSYYGNKRDVIH